MRKTNPLFTPHKLNYVLGQRPQVDCILCGIAENDERVENLTVYRTESFVVSLNLYPYTPGHLLIFPTMHRTDIRELSPQEASELHQLQVAALSVLDSLYHPRGYNIGYNIGQPAGASLEHLHLHIVPRFGNEVGFLDVLAGSRIIVEDPVQTRKRVIKAFSDYFDHSVDSTKLRS